MTINGPAPTILAMFLNTAIDQQLDAASGPTSRPGEARCAPGCCATSAARCRPTSSRRTRARTPASSRPSSRCGAWPTSRSGSSTHEVRNFYSVSISGYHIAEAGANPISQLAFTLANGFTYVEAYLARGMAIDDFAPNLSFFFSNGMDAEYTVLGRVARRIWAVAMRERYGAGERSQKLKYHVQTSGRSLHAQEMDFNDIRTTLQALCAIYDNANSLHTNAYDEAVTTPTAESVRRALAIQMIIDQEWGLADNENPLQGSYVVDELTDLVEEAVLAEFDRIDDRGGVLGAMETGYQRGRIQDESMLYEHRKHDGSLPIVGVNTFLAPDADGGTPTSPELARATEAEKQSPARPARRLPRPRTASEAPAALARLQEAATERRQRLRRAHGRRPRAARSARSATRSSRSAASTAATSELRHSADVRRREPGTAAAPKGQDGRPTRVRRPGGRGGGAVACTAPPLVGQPRRRLVAVGLVAVVLHVAVTTLALTGLSRVEEAHAAVERLDTAQRDFQDADMAHDAVRRRRAGGCWAGRSRAPRPDAAAVRGSPRRSREFRRDLDEVDRGRGCPAALDDAVRAVRADAGRVPGERRRCCWQARDAASGGGRALVQRSSRLGRPRRRAGRGHRRARARRPTALREHGPRRRARRRQAQLLLSARRRAGSRLLGITVLLSRHGPRPGRAARPRARRRRDAAAQPAAATGCRTCPACGSPPATGRARSARRSAATGTTSCRCPAGASGLVMGDVVGHDLRAAARHGAAAQRPARLRRRRRAARRGAARG